MGKPTRKSFPESSRRAFIRHASDVLIEVSEAPGAPHVRRKGHDVSYGGLSFVSDVPIETGSAVKIRIPEIQPVFEAEVRVVWCQHTADQYIIGVQFVEEEDAFRIRMVEQVCSIESYRKEVRERDGRVLTAGEAAQEWIARYAASFPDPRKEE
jgi:hypothetical protein